MFLRFWFAISKQFFRFLIWFNKNMKINKKENTEKLIFQFFFVRNFDFLSEFWFEIGEWSWRSYQFSFAIEFKLIFIWFSIILNAKQLLLIWDCASSRLSCLIRSGHYFQIFYSSITLCLLCFIIWNCIINKYYTFSSSNYIYYELYCALRYFMVTHLWNIFLCYKKFEVKF